MKNKKYRKHIIRSNKIEDFKAHIKDQKRFPKSKERVNIEGRLIKMFEPLDQNHINVIPDFCCPLKELIQITISTFLKNISNANNLSEISNRFCNKTNYSERNVAFAYCVCLNIDIIKYAKDWSSNTMNPKRKDFLISQLENMVNQIKPIENSQLNAQNQINDTVHDHNDITYQQPDEDNDNDQGQHDEINDIFHQQPDEDNNNDNHDETNYVYQFQNFVTNDRNRSINDFSYDDYENYFSYDDYENYFSYDDYENDFIYDDYENIYMMINMNFNF